MLRTNAEAQPHMLVWRAILARAYCDTDQLAEARAQLDALRGGGFDYPPSQQWTSVIVALSLVVSDLEDRSAAAVLYERIRNRQPGGGVRRRRRQPRGIRPVLRD